MRFALAGVGLALLLSVPLAALVGSWPGDALGGTYGWRAGVYTALLLYVVVGAFVLFAKVARYETRPLSAQRVGLWLASLWLWPGLLALGKHAPPPDQPAPGAGAETASAARPPADATANAPPAPPPPPGPPPPG